MAGTVQWCQADHESLKWATAPQSLPSRQTQRLELDSTPNHVENFPQQQEYFFVCKLWLIGATIYVFPLSCGTGTLCGAWDITQPL